MGEAAIRKLDAMLFAVHFQDDPDRLHLRQKHVEEHLAYVAAQGTRVIAGGALRSRPEDPPHSALWLSSAETKEAAQAIIEGDPFFKAGLRQSVDIFHWSRGVWSEPFAKCMSLVEPSEG